MSRSMLAAVILLVAGMVALVGTLTPLGIADDGVKKSSTEEAKKVEAGNVETKTAVFGSGCFWCTETDFEHAPGVLDVVSGYSGGTTDNPNYQTYHDGHHTEVVLIEYDPTKVTFAGLVEWLVKHSDPTDPNGQFVDRGDGYKPVIFYENDEEKEAAERVLEQITSMNVYKAPLAIEVLERTKFWPAEEYHQDFHANPRNRSHYNRYRLGTGRDRYTRSIWGKRLDTLELEGAYPEGAGPKKTVTSK